MDVIVCTTEKLCRQVCDGIKAKQAGEEASDKKQKDKKRKKKKRKMKTKREREKEKKTSDQEITRVTGTFI